MAFKIGKQIILNAFIYLAQCSLQYIHEKNHTLCEHIIDSSVFQIR
jgi:hypothetical protein